MQGPRDEGGDGEYGEQDEPKPLDHEEFLQDHVDGEHALHGVDFAVFWRRVGLETTTVKTLQPQRKTMCCKR